MQLKDIADYVLERISSDCITLENYITTDCLLSDKQGRTMASNMPPQRCTLVRYQKGDVLVSNIRPYLRKIWYADCEGGASADVLVFRAKDGHSSQYLYSVLLQDAFYDWTMKGPKGSRMPRGDKDQIMCFPITDIGNQEQTIGSLIENITKKISLNKQINQNLEALAKQLYDYWFVQFDFPDENGKPYKSSGGAMVYNEMLKREIPKGWEVKQIGDFMRVFTGKKDVSKAIPGEYKFFSCAPESITSNEYIYDGAAVLVSGNGSYTGRVTFYKGKMDLYQRTYACVMDDENYIPYFYYTLKYRFQPIFTGGKHGSAIPYIVLGDLTNFAFVYNEELISKFCSYIKEGFYLQSNNNRETENLIKQRNELLPLLMNGQVNSTLP